jgi:hypothetical protein
MRVVAPDGSFTKENGDLNKVGRLMRDTNGLQKDTQNP